MLTPLMNLLALIILGSLQFPPSIMLIINNHKDYFAYPTFLLVTCRLQHSSTSTTKQNIYKYKSMMTI